MTCPSGHTPFGLSSSAQGFFYVALHSALLQGSKIRVTSLDPSNGIALNPSTINADTDLSDARSTLSIEAAGSLPILVWSDHTSRILRINPLGSSKIIIAKLSNEKEGNIEKIQIRTLARNDGAVDVFVHCQSGISHWLEVYQVGAKGDSLNRKFQIPSVEGPAVFSVATHGGENYLIRTTKREMTLFSSTSDEKLGQWSLQPKPHDDLTQSYDITYAFSEVVARGKSSYAVRTAVFLSSGDWKMIQNDEELWFRPESLSGVIAAAWADKGLHQSLADELAAESHSNPGVAYVHRIKRHARDAKRFPLWVKSLYDRTIHSLLGYGHQLQGVGSSSDSFGFHKVVVAATDSGRLFALDVGNNGKILWSTPVFQTKPGQHWSVESIEVRDDVALVRALGGGILTVNLTQGLIIENHLGSNDPGLKTITNISSPSGSVLPVQVKTDGTVGIPHQNQVGQETVIVTQDEKMAIRGWSLGSTKPSLAWTFVPRSHEKIVSVAARASNDPVASIGKALGDRNVLYKFLNPNLLVIGTINIDARSASFHVLDAISGHVVHTITHPMVDVNQPITCVVSENWFAYALYSNFTDDGAKATAGSPSTSKGYQLVISELFESSLANDRGVLGLTSNSSRLRPGSSDADGQGSHPYVISQTYLVPAAVSFMTVTSTLQGITPRSLLCVIPSLNSIIAIPRAVIDPRRPVGRDATAAEAEEGLFRHDAALDYDPKWALNHMREVRGIQKIISTPSLLESTSLVFAFGSLDMFGTRVSPIGGFDILGKDFNKVQLLGTVAALALGTGLLAPMVSTTMSFS